MNAQTPHPEEIPKYPGERQKGLKIGLLATFVVVVSAAIVILAGRVISAKQVEAVKNQKTRLEILADGRSEVFEAWLDGLAQQGDRLIKSDLFRLYAAEVNLIDGDLSAIFGSVPGERDEDASDLAVQLPMMKNILREFSTYSGFLNARIISREGQAYIATDGYLPPMSDRQVALSQACMRDHQAKFSPLRKTSQGLEMDILAPIYPPESDDDAKPVGALMMTRQVTGKLTELLSNTALSTEGERTRLMQKTAQDFKQVTPWTAEGFSDITADLEMDKNGHLNFAPRQSLSDPAKEVFSLGIAVEGTPWWVVQEADRDMALAAVQSYKRTVYLLAAFGVLTVLLAAGLAWWILAGAHNKRIAEEFRKLAARIEDQKRFIDSINSNITDFITLKDLEGKFTYVNEAFAKALGRDEEDILGMDAQAVFGYDTAKRLCSHDESVVREKKRVTVNEPVYLLSQRYEFKISKSPYLDSQGNCLGIVEVYHDMTEFMAVQERNRKLIRRAMEALGNTIEATDPYLGGHTKLLAGLSVEVAKSLNLSEMEIAEIETAANLSQIGMMFVPKEILTKPDRLNDEEKAIMEQHVEHAYRILRKIDIDDGVLRAIYQMNERMDGSGYPKGLADGEIIMPARILSAVNSFCAMIRPRSYRGAKTMQEALDVLRKDSARYDDSVLEALSETLSSPAGEKLIVQQ
jgi:PAS domain S-box-containing protein